MQEGQGWLRDAAFRDMYGCAIRVDDTVGHWGSSLAAF
jgi:hypothetical protein